MLNNNTNIKKLTAQHLLNHIKAGSSENRYRVEMQVYRSALEKIRSITFLVWLQGRVKKMSKKGKKM